jgi:methyl-accepting chemotaxis protein
MDSLKSALRRGTQTIKEKLGKAQTTVDEEYQTLYGQFDSTYKTSQNFVKHVGQLIENFHAMSSTFHFLAEDFRDLYSHTHDESKKEASLLLMSIAEELEKNAVLPFVRFFNYVI